MNKQVLVVGVAVLFAVTGVAAMIRLARQSTSTDEVATRFVHATIAGDIAGMRKALDSVPSLINATFGEESALHIAARANQVKAAEFLLDHGAKLNARGRWNGTALHWACWFGSKDAAELLIRKGLKIEDKSDVFGSTPLLWAAHGSASIENPEGDYVATVQMLIQNGASADTCNSEGTSAVAIASTPVAEVLQKHGAKAPKATTRPIYGEVA